MRPDKLTVFDHRCAATQHGSHCAAHGCAYEFLKPLLFSNQYFRRIWKLAVLLLFVVLLCVYSLNNNIRSDNLEARALTDFWMIKQMLIVVGNKVIYLRLDSGGNNWGVICN